jgi:2-methylfumaryl-CoA isomerase
VALAVLGHLGHIGEVAINGVDRPRYGNYLYGAFGRDFVTSDGRRVMVTAITPRQFAGLVEATGLASEIREVETRLGRPLRGEADVFEAREAIAEALERWFAVTPYTEAAERFTAHRVLWGPYQTVGELLESDIRATLSNPLFAEVEQPGVGRLLTPGSPLDLGDGREQPAPAPVLGQHTEEILVGVLGLGVGEIGDLIDRGVVACA